MGPLPEVRSDKKGKGKEKETAEGSGKA